MTGNLAKDCLVLGPMSERITHGRRVLGGHPRGLRLAVTARLAGQAADVHAHRFRLRARITSLGAGQADAGSLAGIARGQWGIENF